MVYRKLVLSDKDDLELLIKKTENSLADKTFWLPINSVSRQHFFDPAWTYFLGAFEKEELIGAVGLFFNEHEYKESRDTLGLVYSKIAECGRAMVLPNHRNKGVATSLLNSIMVYAKSLRTEYLIATVHPDNVASKAVLVTAGFLREATVVKQEIYKRDIMLLRLY